nr:FkbM family methyltransferase [Aestuariivivens marinum]
MLWNDLLKVNNKGIVYDVGAYTGIYSLIAAKISENNKVFAFDIQENTLERLKKNCELNKLKNINLVRAACTNFNGIVDFYFYKEQGIISSVASLIPKKMNDHKDEVNAIKLDGFHSRTIDKNPVSLVKIDVEDAEQDTLRGMLDILEHDRPDVLVEINNIKNLSKVKRLFPRYYNIYDIDENNYSINRLMWFSKPSEFRNYLFTTKDKKEIKELFSGLVV